MQTLHVIYGGSFDPVHYGHMAVARTARDVLQAEVTLLPLGDPPHKARTEASGEIRAQLLELAIVGEAGLHVDRREIRRTGLTYTVDTLLELRAALGAQTPLAWLLGADAFLKLHTWHRWQELFDLAHWVVVPRPDTPFNAAILREQTPLVLAQINGRWLPPEALKESPAGGFCVLPLPEPRMESSSALRQRIQRGDTWRDWTPPAVADAIEQAHLYRASPL
jgi:nicotinate-nucleotide adenylyltransferase